MKLKKDTADYYITKIQCALKCTTLEALYLYNHSVQKSKENNSLIKDEVEGVILREKKGGVYNG